MTASPDPSPLRKWFRTQGWQPFPFQEAVWKAYGQGKSGLLHAPTGLGKTYAVFGGPLLEALAKSKNAGGSPGEALRILWITPLRALANDTAKTLREPAEDLGLRWEVALRHGDVSAYRRRKQRERYPPVLVITPESLSLLLTYEDTLAKFASLQSVIVDEWHELLGTKRGVQTELCLARLKRWLPSLRIWGLSATLGNLEQAKQVLLGSGHTEGITVGAEEEKTIEIETLIPKTMDQFPWSGHLGGKMAGPVAKRIDRGRTTLIFTNTRNQAELWYQKLRELRPQWGDQLALHHGSIDKEVREALEEQLRMGEVRAVVCTSSLDLGVDFSPVDQVVQIGSPKGIARLLQRAGRSGHQPGAVSRIIGVPTNALELVEFAAARDAAGLGEIEARRPIEGALDVLVQHVVTLALAGGSTFETLRAEVSATHAYRQLSESEWAWVVDFACHGGPTLQRYPAYQRVAIDPDSGELSVPSREVAQFHRMSIGTITSDTEVLVKMKNGRRLGAVEEGFISRLRAGARFHFAGRHLELVRVHGLTATVMPASKAGGTTPAWQGSRSPLSSELALAVSRRLSHADLMPSPEMDALQPLLERQRATSIVPSANCLLVEATEVDGLPNFFLYPFAGRLVHEGLAALLAYRLGKDLGLSFRTTINDYGLSLQLDRGIDVGEAEIRALISGENLLDDLLACMNASELARRQFREISRVAGLVIQGYPGRQKSMRQIQTSSNLLYDVFEKYDPENLLLHQARREILSRQLEYTRLQETLARLREIPLIFRQPQELTPMSFPLWAEQLHADLSTEDWQSQLKRMLTALDNQQVAQRPKADSEPR